MTINNAEIGIKVKVNHNYIGKLNKTTTKTGIITSIKNVQLKHTVEVLLDGYKKPQEWHIYYLDIVKEEAPDGKV